jgi:hypothetical protein
MAKFLILSPALDQSLAVAEFILRERSAERPVGVLLPGEDRPWRPHPFGDFVPIEAVNEGEGKLIPTGSRSTALLLESGDIALGSATMTQSALRFYDKHWSIAAAEAADLPVPETFATRDAISAYPVFYKSDNEGGGARGIARSADTLPATPGLIYQEFVDSPGTYGVTFVAENGKMVVMQAHFERESYPATGGSAVLIEQMHDSRLLAHAERLIAHTGFTGWGVVEFKFSPRLEDYVFMELNAKLWASLEFTFRNEPLFGRLLLGVDCGGRPVERMLFMHRAFARGPAFMAGELPHLLRGAELRFVGSHWPLALANALLPRSAIGMLRRVRRRRS